MTYTEKIDQALADLDTRIDAIRAQADADLAAFRSRRQALRDLKLQLMATPNADALIVTLRGLGLL